MEFETVNHSPFVMDHMESSNGFLLDNGMESFLQYPPSSPQTYSTSLLPATSSPMSLGLTLGGGEYTYSPESYGHRELTPAFEGTTVSPPMIGYTLSNPGDHSSDELNNGRHSRGSNGSPPPTIPYAATIPRSTHRYNPIAVPTHLVSATTSTRSRVRRATTTRKNTNEDSDIDEDDHPSSGGGGGAETRRETVRRQRIESEQKRRDELRDGYTKLREALPAMSQKCSKVVLLDRASQHIKQLSAVKNNLENRLKASEDEVNRLRNVNETLMLSTANHRRVLSHGMHTQQF
jgi:hypothetical protein